MGNSCLLWNTESWDHLTFLASSCHVGASMRWPSIAIISILWFTWPRAPGTTSLPVWTSWLGDEIKTQTRHKGEVSAWLEQSEAVVTGMGYNIKTVRIPTWMEWGPEALLSVEVLFESDWEMRKNHSPLQTWLQVGSSYLSRRPHTFVHRDSTVLNPRTCKCVDVIY